MHGKSVNLFTIINVTFFLRNTLNTMAVFHVLARQLCQLHFSCYGFMLQLTKMLPLS